MEKDDVQELKELLKDLIWLNGVIATELIQITENTSRAIRNGELPEGCRIAHNELREKAVEILSKHRSEEAKLVADHILKH